MLPDPVVKLAGQAADDRLVAGVGEAESAAGEAAEMFVRADEDDRLAHLLGLHGGGDAGRGQAVDNHVVVGGWGGGGAQEDGCKHGREIGSRT